jgi:hypothetical protein
MEFAWEMPDVEELYNFCASHLHWTKERVDTEIKPAMTALKSRSVQTRIESYFTYESNEKSASVNSSRLQAALSSTARRKK